MALPFRAKAILKNQGQEYIRGIRKKTGGDKKTADQISRFQVHIGIRGGRRGGSIIYIEKISHENGCSFRQQTNAAIAKHLVAAVDIFSPNITLPKDFLTVGYGGFGLDM